MGSFTRAAERLGCAGPTVEVRIGVLEQKLGVTSCTAPPAVFR
ncbi:helix-turn-helix domain-containing protein [Pseudomonas aeruginosa]